MDIHRKFNFDDPEDSYWNETQNNKNESTSKNTNFSQKNENFFEDASLNQSVKDSSASTFNDIQREISNLSNKWIDVSFNDVQSLSDKSSNSKFGELTNFERKILNYGSASMVSDCSLGSQSSEVTVHLDYARLRSEHKKLQKHFESVRIERYNPIPIAEAIKRMQCCQPVSLDLYKTKTEKLNLLEAALCSIDHDVITTVILFLKKTLINSIFREILITTSTAAEHYILHLKETSNIFELIDTLFALGRSDEAAMVEFSEACQIRQPKLKIQALRKCLISGFSVSTLKNEMKFVQEYIDLLAKG